MCFSCYQQCPSHSPPTHHQVDSFFSSTHPPTPLSKLFYSYFLECFVCPTLHITLNPQLPFESHLFIMSSIIYYYSSLYILIIHSTLQNPWLLVQVTFLTKLYIYIYIYIQHHIVDFNLLRTEAQQLLCMFLSLYSRLQLVRD